ncbi:nucleotidyl transferase AbiEii/AbiGii toxin family protein (plasmid) [Streptomyces sp. DSM 116496]|uniref:nucleotidyl transferase AbiEii/AbiGii toxin family protein n=1 Tax=Streptomyces stoeckheimensis TaxID=3344656 RepID=UPI0038B372D0
MPELHARLLADVLALGSPYPLVLTGGYAVQAHELLERVSQDLDLATESPTPMDEIAEAVRAGLTERGWQVAEVEIAPLSARFQVTDPLTGEACEVDVLKEVFWRPIAQSAYGPVLAEEDVIGTKVRALADRGAARDFLDVYAASRRWTTPDLEEFGRRHARGRFSPQDLQSRLAGADWIDDAELIAYGLDESAMAALRTWAQLWSDDLARRLHEDDADRD